MEQLGLRRKDLEPLIGTRTRVAEVFKLQAQPVDCDHSAIGIPAEVLIRPSRKKKAAWQVWW